MAQKTEKNWRQIEGKKQEDRRLNKVEMGALKRLFQGETREIYSSSSFTMKL